MVIRPLYMSTTRNCLLRVPALLDGNIGSNTGRSLHADCRIKNIWHVFLGRQRCNKAVHDRYMHRPLTLIIDYWKYCCSHMTHNFSTTFHIFNAFGLPGDAAVCIVFTKILLVDCVTKWPVRNRWSNTGSDWSVLVLSLIHNACSTLHKNWT